MGCEGWKPWLLAEVGRHVVTAGDCIEHDILYSAVRVLMREKASAELGSAGIQIPMPRWRPTSHDTPLPRTVAASCCPSRCSITDFQGTRLNPMPSSSIA